MSFLSKINKKVKVTAGAAVEVMIAPNVWETVVEQPSANINSKCIKEELKQLQKEYPDKKFRITKTK